MSPIKPNPAKVLLRSEIASRIAALTMEEKKRQSQIVYDKVINNPWYKSSNRIALYMSTDQEIDTMPLINHIKARGAAAFVPQYAGGVMRMLRLEAGDEESMPLTKHGIAQHSKDQKREDGLETGLDLIIAPGVAFTKAGERLGHGGGYYDKYLANIRSTQKIAPKIRCPRVDHSGAACCILTCALTALGQCAGKHASSGLQPSDSLAVRTWTPHERGGAAMEWI